MEITYKDLDRLEFPVYVLPSYDIDVEDGLIYCDGKLIDDLNQLGPTLGLRRLQSPHKMRALRTGYEDVRGVILSKKNVFIDNIGNIYKYKRTKQVTIKFHKLKEVQLKDTVTVLKFYEIRQAIKVKRPPPDGISWVGLIYIKGTPWAPYEYSYERCADFRRKI